MLLKFFIYLLRRRFHFLFKIEQRFRTPITASECEKFNKSWVSDASRRKWAWVLKVFEEWKKQRNEAVLRWLDWIFLGGYLPSLSVNYVGMSKDMEKRLPELYYIKMKISYDLGFIAIGVAMAT